MPKKPSKTTPEVVKAAPEVVKAVSEVVKPVPKKKGKMEITPEVKPEPDSIPEVVKVVKKKGKMETKPELEPIPVVKVIKNKGKNEIPVPEESVPEVVKEVKVIKKKNSLPEPKEKPVPEVVKKGKTIKPTEDLSKIEAEYNTTFKEWESVNQSLSTLKKDITIIEEKRHNILTQLNKLLKKMQGDDNENITNPLEAPSTLKKEITKVVISPKASASSEEEDDEDEEEEDESIKKGIQKFNQADSDSDTDSD